MNRDFYLHLAIKHEHTDCIPSNEDIAGWAQRLLNLLYPERSPSWKPDINAIESLFTDLERDLIDLIRSTQICRSCDAVHIANVFFHDIPELYRKLNTDVEAIMQGDPAASSKFEIVRTYPGFFAISIYRIAHSLTVLGVPLIPRILTEFAHSKTGIDIHPNAQIGEYLYIDHGTGLVIGETCIIGHHVKLYQGVTLGALSVGKHLANVKRHPTIGNYVIIYSGATILGGETVIANQCIIGGNVWLTQSVPPNSTVYHQSVVKVIETKLESE